MKQKLLNILNLTTLGFILIVEMIFFISTLIDSGNVGTLIDSLRYTNVSWINVATFFNKLIFSIILLGVISYFITKLLINLVNKRDINVEITSYRNKLNLVYIIFILYFLVQNILYLVYPSTINATSNNTGLYATSLVFLLIDLTLIILSYVLKLDDKLSFIIVSIFLFVFFIVATLDLSTKSYPPNIAIDVFLYFVVISDFVFSLFATFDLLVDKKENNEVKEEISDIDKISIELDKIEKLHNDGKISDEEYKKLRDKILNL